MGTNEKLANNLYSRRLKKETAISDGEIAARMRWDMPILSKNPKCSISLDLPLHGCIPTKSCREVCYAAQGRGIFQKSLVKSLAVERLIELDAEHVARKMVDEAAGRNIRIAGSGEILPCHAPLLSYVEQFGGSWWGMTRRIDTHKVLPSLMFSIDASTPTSTMQYVREHVPTHRRAYLRRPQDGPSPLECAVTFPVHRYRDKVPYHETDCPVDRKEMEGCWSCKRCY